MPIFWLYCHEWVSYKLNLYAFLWAGDVSKTEYCSVELTEEKYQAFVYAVKSHYWYQMYIDDLPIWGMFFTWPITRIMQALPVCQNRRIIIWSVLWSYQCCWSNSILSFIWASHNRKAVNYAKWLCVVLSFFFFFLHGSQNDLGTVWRNGVTVILVREFCAYCDLLRGMKFYILP